MEKTEQLKSRPLSRLIVSLSAPAIVSLLCNSVNMAIDRMFIARGVGTLALSAVTIAFGLYLVMQACSQLIGAGASSVMAVQLGKGDRGKGEKIIGNALLLSFLLSLAITITGILFINPLLKIYGADAGNISYSREYTGILFLGSICFVLSQSMNSIVRGMGYAKRSLINFLSSIIVNVILDAIFILVFKWGVRGAALATVTGNFVCAVLAVQFLCSKRNPIKLRARNVKLDKKTIVSILSIGASGFIGQLSLSIVTLVFNRVCRVYGGNTAVAAYGIISTVLMLVYMPMIGLGQGIQPIVGCNYGALLYSRVKGTILKAFWYAAAFCIVMFLIFEIFSPQIIAVFGGALDPALSGIAVTGLRIYGLMTPVVGMQMAGANFFQYIGKVRQSMFLSALRQLILLIPLTLVLPLAFKLPGVWAAAPVSDCVSFLITMALIKVEINRLNGLISGKR